MKFKSISLWKLYFREMLLLFTLLITIISFKIFYCNVKSDNISEVSFAISIFYALYIFMADYVNGCIYDGLNKCFSNYYEAYIEILDVIETLNRFIKRKNEHNELTLFLIKNTNYRISREKFGQLEYIYFSKYVNKIEKYLLEFYKVKYNLIITEAQDSADDFIKKNISSSIRKNICIDKTDILLNPIKWLNQNYKFDFDECFYNKYQEFMREIQKKNRTIILKKRILSNTICFLYKVFLFKLNTIKRKIYLVFGNEIDKEFADNNLKKEMLNSLNNIIKDVNYCREISDDISNIQVDKYELQDDLNEIIDRIKMLEEKIDSIKFDNLM